jgi:predicted RNA binding protein YcfA (HicA-like mRNA interferase family)
MPKLRVLSGRDVLTILGSFGFQVLTQRGSHIKLRRVLPDGQTQTLTVPDHKEMDRGTLHAIYRQACRFIPETDLRPRFFTE